MQSYYLRVARDIESWEGDLDWEAIDPDGEDIDEVHTAVGGAVVGTINRIVEGDDMVRCR